MSDIKKILFLSLIFFVSSIYADNDNKGEEADKEKYDIIEVIELGTDIWCPYACDEGSSEYLGYMNEVTKEAFRLYNIEVEIKKMPWSEAIAKSKTGEINGVIGASKDELPNFIFPDQPIAFGYTSAYTLKDSNWLYQGIDSLENKKLGLILSYRYPPAINSYFYLNFPLFPQYFYTNKGVNAVQEQIQALLNRQTDIYIENEQVMRYWLDELGIENVRRAGRISNSQEELFVAFGPHNLRSYELSDILVRGYNRLRNSGRLVELQNKYQLRNLNVWRE